MTFFELMVISVVGYFGIFSLVSRICQCIEKIAQKKRLYMEKTFWATEFKKNNEFNEEFKKELDKINKMIKENFTNAFKK